MQSEMLYYIGSCSYSYKPLKTFRECQTCHIVEIYDYIVEKLPFKRILY